MSTIHKITLIFFHWLLMLDAFALSSPTSMGSQYNGHEKIETSKLPGHQIRLGKNSPSTNSFDNNVLNTQTNISESNGSAIHNGDLLNTFDLLQLNTVPKNITDMYKGTWFIRNGTENFLNGTKFNKLAGHFVFQLINKPTVADSIDSIEGDLVLRNGVYSTDDHLKFMLQGVYMNDIGVAFVVANPAGNPYLDDISFVLSPNASLAESFQNASNSALESYAQSNNTNDLCFMTILFQMSPVSADWNEKYEEYYNNFYRHRTYDSDESSLPAPKYTMKGFFLSPNCNFTLEFEAATIEFAEYYAKAVNYVVVVSLFSVIEVLALIKQMEYTSTQSGATKVSLLTIGQQAMMDSYLCLIHLITGIYVERVFSAFITAAFFKFVAFSIFEMRYLLSIWKARRPQAFAEFTTMGREVGMLYARFYSLLLAGFILLYFLNGLFIVFLFLMYSFFVPQILWNAYRGTAKALLPQYVLAVAVGRAFIPLYFFGCPVNFIHAEPDFTASIYLVIWISFQVLVLFLQDFLGPRFFIPNSLLPPKYDYRRHFVPRNIEEPVDCVICMSPIEMQHRDYMVTPCDHVFHAHCLLQWLDHKLECPTCRGALPAV